MSTPNSLVGKLRGLTASRSLFASDARRRHGVENVRGWQVSHSSPTLIGQLPSSFDVSFNPA
jgi:hypothetical protein